MLLNSLLRQLPGLGRNFSVQNVRPLYSFTFLTTGVLQSNPALLATFATTAKKLTPKQKELQKSRREAAKSRLQEQKEKNREMLVKKRERAVVNKEKLKEKNERKREMMKERREKLKEKEGEKKERQREKVVKARERTKIEKEKEKQREKKRILKEKKDAKPKRYAQPFSFYLAEQYPAVKSNLTAPERMKEMASKWKNLTESEKKPYIEKSQKARQSYVKAVELYKQNKPKRPLSPYIIFANEVRGSVSTSNPGLPVTEIAKKIGGMWRNLTETEKKGYQKKAQRL